jgi:hypothetical protein
MVILYHVINQQAASVRELRDGYRERGQYWHPRTGSYRERQYIYSGIGIIGSMSSYKATSVTHIPFKTSNTLLEPNGTERLAHITTYRYTS